MKADSRDSDRRLGTREEVDEAFLGISEGRIRRRRSRLHCSPVASLSMSTTESQPCRHERVRCLNQYDPFRKYLCETCGSVYLCECEREIVTALYPHKTNDAPVAGTGDRLPVNGFARQLCAECRGEKEEPSPKAAIWGLKDKVSRFYWREIMKTYAEHVLRWTRQRGVEVSDVFDFQARFPDESARFEREAKQEWKTRHKTLPKWKTTEPNKSDILGDLSIPETVVHARYEQIERDGQRVGKWHGESGALVGAENIACEFYVRGGFTAIVCERRLITCWAATFLCIPIQGREDPRVRLYFRETTRNWSRDRVGGETVTIPLPDDFGTKEYYERRKLALDDWVQGLGSTQNIVPVFDALLEQSASLRDYLWVTDDAVVQDARRALMALPPSVVSRCLDWVIRDFWNRQPGWPDLFVFSETGFRFVEVKSPLDELSQEQMRWFAWALRDGKLPCEVCKVRPS